MSNKDPLDREPSNNTPPRPRDPQDNEPPTASPHRVVSSFKERRLVEREVTITEEFTSD